MGTVEHKRRIWLSRLLRSLVLLGLLLTIVGMIEDFASRFGPPVTSSRGAFGVSYGDSPVEGVRWLGIDEVRPGGAAERAGIRPGDGIKFDQFMGEQFGWNPGETAAVTVDHDGRRFRTILTAQTPPPTSADKGLPLFDWFVLLLEPLMVGLLALLLFRGQKNRAAALLGISIMFWFEPGLRLLPHWSVAPLTLLVGLPVRAAALYCWPVLAMEISGGTASSRQVRLVPWAAAMLAVAFFGFQLASTLRVPFPAEPEPLSVVAYLADLALGLVVIVRNYRRNDPAGRNRIKIVLAAFGILFLGITAAVLLRVLGIFEGARGWMLLICLSTALGLLGYAALSKKLFDFGFAINRTLVYGAAAFTLLVVFGLFEYIAKSMIPVAWPTAGPFISAGLAVLLFLSFHRLHHWFEHYIERFFFKSWHESEEALRRFVKSAAHFEHVSALCREFVAEVRRFAGGAEAALYLRGEDGRYVLAAGRIKGCSKLWPDEDRGFALMRAERGPLELSGTQSALPGELAIPMLGQLGLMGFVLLGGKADGTNLRPDEMEVLGWSAHHVGLEIQAMRARELQAEVANLRAQLARMAEPA